MSVAIANTFCSFSTMSSAAERAEARRKAILAKRGDRLAKLTTSARGEEGVYLGSDGRYQLNLLVLEFIVHRCFVAFKGFR